ncbi:hypothetical protein ACQ4PT_037743 [Festuca glaucescens]
MRKMSDAVKLIGTFTCPIVHRMEVALRLKGIPYEFIEEDLGNKSELLLKHNPIHKKCWGPTWVALWAAEGEGKEAAAREAKAKANLALLEGQLGGKRFFGGDRVGFLDLVTSGFAHWLGVYEEMGGTRLLAEDEHPALWRWAREYTADATVRHCLPDREALLAAMATSKERFVSAATAMEMARK